MCWPSVVPQLLWRFNKESVLLIALEACTSRSRTK